MNALSIEGLSVDLPTGADRSRAVHCLDLEVPRGEVLCVVGESGSGKSVVAQAVMGLLPKSLPVTAGRILLAGRDLLKATREEIRSARSAHMAMIFQEPMTALNPVMACGAQIDEVLRRHTALGSQERRKRVLRMLEQVGLDDPGRIHASYPHQLSGGQRQRIMIAMALILKPALLIADEPTTALDVTIQAQVLGLMRQLRREFGTAIVLITHDLGVVAEMADRVVVMYAGQVVEQAPVKALFAMPQHPYTVGLMGAIPNLAGGEDRLSAIDGLVPAATDLPPGCRFASRCPFVEPRCRASVPALQEVEPGHWSRCWRAPMQALAAQLDLEPGARVDPVVAS